MFRPCYDLLDTCLYIYYWIYFLLKSKTKFLLPHAYVTVADFGYHIRVLSFFCSQTLLNNLVLQCFDFQRIWWRLFQRSVVCTKFDYQRTDICNVISIVQRLNWHSREYINISVFVCICFLWEIYFILILYQEGF